MQFQVWVLSYFLASAFCYIETFYLYRSKNINRKMLSYLVFSAGCWSLLDGLTQLTHGDVALSLQYGVLFVSFIVAFIFLYFSYSLMNALSEKMLSLLLLIPIFLGLVSSLFIEIFVGTEERTFDGIRYIHIIYNDILYTVTVLFLFIPLFFGFVFLVKSLRKLEEPDLKKKAIYFTVGMLFAVVSSYVLGTSEVIYHTPPVASIAISVGIGIASLSFGKD